MSDVFIKFSATNPTYDTIGNIEFLSQRGLNTDFSVRTIKSFSNISNIIESKFGIFSTFTNHILGVIFMRPNKQMIRIDASRIITGVTDKMPLWNGFIPKMNNAKLMSRNSCSLAAESRISFIKAFSPNPTSIRLNLYERLKSFDVLLNSSWWRHFTIIQQNTKLPNSNLLKGI